MRCVSFQYRIMSHKGITDSLHSAKQYLQMGEIELQISLEIGQLSIQEKGI